ncbi:MAG: hypothetical protein ACRDRL_26455 [Sciscionella sp.]
MTQRSVHLVGTYPAETTLDAMSSLVRALGARLKTLPDGEVGERGNWLVCIIDGLREHPDFELVKDGDWRDYEHIPRFRIRPRHRVTPATLNLGYAENARTSYAEFAKLKEQNLELRHTDFQVGIASDLDLAFFTFGPLGGFTKRSLFRNAIAGDLERVAPRIRDDIVFQIEIPVELVLTATLPAPIDAMLARILAKGVAKTVSRAPKGARFGMHLCLGDLGHKALKQPASARPMVVLANALARHWPADRRLEYLHVPLAFGDVPPVLHDGFYRPLERLEIPPETRFIAGFVHEEQSLEQQHQVLGMVERYARRTVDVASACGLGRRTAGTRPRRGGQGCRTVRDVIANQRLPDARGPHGLV